MSDIATILRIEPRRLDENEPLTASTSTHVVISNIAADPTPEQSMRIVEVSGTLDFWDREEENIYTADDGEPV
ncbi:MAG: hypothetical protein IH986_11205 [Planctomycetes bacterium]|nr:hypothetical protein [Planctomycetota bacterium]